MFDCACERQQPAILHFLHKLRKRHQIMDQFQIYVMNLLIRGLSILGIEKKKVDGKCKK